MESTQLLKEIYLFQELTPLELIQFNKILESRKANAGEVIIAEGDDADEMYIIKDGECVVTKKTSDGEDTLAMMEQGAHFGEIALIDRAARSATVKAESDVDLLVMNQKDFMRVLNADTKVKIKIYEAFLSTLCRRLRNANETLITAHELEDK